jgi:regulator of nucleoside diphosphate kinase
MIQTITVPPITITRRDSDRLQSLVEAAVEAPRPAEVIAFLDEELARAEIVAPQAVGPAVATMNSRVEYEDVSTGHRRTVTLVYPSDADIAAGRLSVLTPAGVALLGLSEGQEIAWQLSDGRGRRFRLLKVTFQPEAAGLYEL